MLERLRRQEGFLEATADIHGFRKQQRFMSESRLGRSISRSHFSDTVVFSCTPERSDAHLMIEDIRRLWMHHIEMGHYLRGGLTIGDARHDEGAVFGPALVDAYRLERAVASYPRIVVSDEAAVALEKFQLEGGPPLFRDEDGLVCFDLFPRHAEALGNPDLGGFLVRIRSQVTKDFEGTRDTSNYSDPVIALNLRAKFGWLVKYIDGVIEDAAAQQQG